MLLGPSRGIADHAPLHGSRRLIGAFGCGTERVSEAPATTNFRAGDGRRHGSGTHRFYYGHPVLKAPQLDAMAAAGLRFDRFYAGTPNCSPTRATVMMGRTNDRTGVEDHGFALRRQERTIARGLGEAGYATGHFGKWQLNGLRGPGVPMIADDAHGPGVFGFENGCR